MSQLLSSFLVVSASGSKTSDFKYDTDTDSDSDSDPDLFSPDAGENYYDR
jgi:hypothetical protein